MKFESNLFTLSPSQEDTSKMMYNGKVIKCLVAPYHSYAALEKLVPFTKTTLLFPEREMNASQMRGLISMIVNKPGNEEWRIITASQSVIIDMVDDCVRILTEDGDIVPCPVKTFCANIHDIRYSVLENEKHQSSPENKSKAHDLVNILIERINASETVSRKEYDDMMNQAKMIGEPIISNKLQEMIHDLDIK